MEEEGQEGPIKCIFLCKFHDELGPVIVCQYPENFISKEVFEAINTYLISKLQIQKRTITLSVSELKVSGYPNAIKNDKYFRNVFIFNLCFVCDSKSRTVQYEPVIKKLSEYLENLELEYGFLSSEESKCKLPDILAQILDNLNAKGQCTIKIALENQPIMERRISMRGEKKLEVDFGKSYCGKQEKRYSSFSERKVNENKDKACPMIQGKNKPYISVLNMKQVTGVRPDPVQVHDHHVPILVCSRNEALHLSHHWDLTTQQILPYIDGLSHIAKIAAEADVHNNLVKACVQNLSYYRVVKLLPIFQYSNIYTTLPGLHKLYTTQEIQEDCLKSVSKNVVRLPSLATVFQMYCSLTYGLSVRDLCLRFNPQTLGIDERKLIQYGLLHGFIRRLHHYPVLAAAKGSNEEPQIMSPEPFYRMCNGLHSMDEISCKFGMSHQEVMDKLEKDPTNGIAIILK